RVNGSWSQFEGGANQMSHERHACQFVQHFCAPRFHPRSQPGGQYHHVSHCFPHSLVRSKIDSTITRSVGARRFIYRSGTKAKAVAAIPIAHQMEQGCEQSPTTLYKRLREMQLFPCDEFSKQALQ